MVPPQALFLPIKKISQIREEKKIQGMISPQIDGRVTDYYEWQNAGVYDTQKITEAYCEKRLISKVHFGYNQENIFIRVDFSNLLVDVFRFEKIALIINFLSPKPCKLTIPMEDACQKNLLQCREGKGYVICPLSTIETMCQKVLEVKIPLLDIETSLGQTIQFMVSAERVGREVERWPMGNLFEIPLPSDAEMASRWMV